MEAPISEAASGYAVRTMSCPDADPDVGPGAWSGAGGGIGGRGAGRGAGRGSRSAHAHVTVKLSKINSKNFIVRISLLLCRPIDHLDTRAVISWPLKIFIAPGKNARTFKS